MRNRLPNKALVALLAAMPALACSGDAAEGAQTSVLESVQDAAYYMADRGGQAGAWTSIE